MSNLVLGNENENEESNFEKEKEEEECDLVQKYLKSK